MRPGAATVGWDDACQTGQRPGPGSGAGDGRGGRRSLHGGPGDRRRGRRIGAAGGRSAGAQQEARRPSPARPRRSRRRRWRRRGGAGRAGAGADRRTRRSWWPRRTATTRFGRAARDQRAGVRRSATDRPGSATEGARRLPARHRLPSGGTSVRAVAAGDRDLDALRAPELATRVTERSIFVLPVGATEQHGPHLPFNTDTRDRRVRGPGDRAARWATRSTSGCCRRWPTRSPTSTPGPRGRCGSRPRTLLSVLDDLGRCVATTPARRLVFLNGHGGNSALLNVACRELRLHHGLQTFLAHPSVPARPGRRQPGRGAGHGHPRRPGRDLADAAPPARPGRPGRRFPQRARTSRRQPSRALRRRRCPSAGSRTTSDPSGHIGDPTGATAERGKSLFEAAVDAFSQALAEVAAFDFGRP